MNDLKNNEVIESLRNGRLIFAHKSLEGLTAKGKEALAIIQRGLISLELMKPIEESEYGVYGPKTEKAVNYLQNWAGIDRVQGWDGRKFESDSLNALEKALQEKINGRWNPPQNIILFFRIAEIFA